MVVVVAADLIAGLGLALGVFAATDDSAVPETAVHVSAADLFATIVVALASVVLPPAHVFCLTAADGNRSFAHAKKSHMVPHPPTGNASNFSLVGAPSGATASSSAAASSMRSATV